MAGKKIGYIRVSSDGQNTVRQLEGINLDREFTDTMTDSVKEQPQLYACLDYLREGDTLHVHSIDRLARNLRDLKKIVDGLISRGVTVVFNNEQLTFSGDDSAIAQLTLQIMGAFAEFERSVIKSRQRDGINAAKAKGKHLGRPKLNKALSVNAKQLKEDGLNVVAIAKELKISRPSVYKLLD